MDFCKLWYNINALKGLCCYYMPADAYCCGNHMVEISYREPLCQMCNVSG